MGLKKKGKKCTVAMVSVLILISGKITVVCVAKTHRHGDEG